MGIIRNLNCRQDEKAAYTPKGHKTEGGLRGCLAQGIAGTMCGFCRRNIASNKPQDNFVLYPFGVYMSKPAITADSLLTIREVERLFYRHNIGHLPVTENNHLAGILTRYDYLQYQKRKGDA